jgi:hypothetical protein
MENSNVMFQVLNLGDKWDSNHNEKTPKWKNNNRAGS